MSPVNGNATAIFIFDSFGLHPKTIPAIMTLNNAGLNFFTVCTSDQFDLTQTNVDKKRVHEHRLVKWRRRKRSL